MAKTKKKPSWNSYWKTKDDKSIPESEWKCGIGPKEYPYTQNITPEQKVKLDQLLKEFESVFAKDLNDLGYATIIEHKIDTGDARPNRPPPPPNRYTWSNGDFIEAKVDRML